MLTHSQALAEAKRRFGDGPAAQARINAFMETWRGHTCRARRHSTQADMLGQGRRSRRRGR